MIRRKLPPPQSAITSRYKIYIFGEEVTDQQTVNKEHTGVKNIHFFILSSCCNCVYQLLQKHPWSCIHNDFIMLAHCCNYKPIMFWNNADVDVDADLDQHCWWPAEWKQNLTQFEQKYKEYKQRNLEQNYKEIQNNEIWKLLSNNGVRLADSQADTFTKLLLHCLPI